MKLDMINTHKHVRLNLVNKIFTHMFNIYSYIFIYVLYVL